MANHSGAHASGTRLRMRDDFMDGLKCFRSDDYEGALLFFRAADECAEMDDIYQSRYTSFHGLSRVYMGDSSGVKLCRKAAVGETRDAEVYYNLAMAEYRLGYRESSYMALRRGLKLDPGHSGLLHLKQQLVLREKHGFIPGLKRNHILNRLIGKLFRGTRQSYSNKE
jgi:tetratricopeptide (TPR) repeat protein